MAYIVTTSQELSEAAAASFTPSAVPEHVTDDLIICCVTQDGGATTIATASTGWNAIGTQAASGGSRQVWFYKVATSSSEAAPVFTGANDDWIAQFVIVRDVDTTTPIHDSLRINWASVETLDINGLTTTNNDCFLLYSCGSDNITEMMLDPNAAINLNRAANIGCASVVSYVQQFTAGAVPTVNMLHEVTNEGGNAWIIAINNKSGGNRDIAVKSAIAVQRYMGSLGGVAADYVTAATSITGLTTIDGNTVSSTIPTLADSGVSSVIPWGNITTFTCAAAGPNIWQGGNIAMPAAIDLESNAFAFYYGFGTRATNRVGPKGVIVVFADSSNNWAAFTLRTYAQLATNAFYSFVLQPPAMTPLDSGGTIDYSDITTVGFYVQRPLGTTGTVFSMANLAELPTCQIVGGSAARPFVATDLDAILNANRFYQIAQTQGSGQAVAKQPLKLGNGTDATFARLTANSIEMARPRFTYAVEDSISNIEIHASASDTYDLSGCILATAQENDFTINSASSASATYNFSGLVLRGWNVTNNASVTIGGASIFSSPSITLNGGTLDACAISSSGPVTTSNPANITDCDFTSGGTGHAITITATGTFAFEGNTFTGYGADATTDAAIYNNSGGAVTLTVPTGGQVPTVLNGAGASTTISTPAAGYTLELPNIIDGSRYQIYNVTAATELDNALVSGGAGISHLYTESVDFTVGDIGRYRVTYQSGTTAKQPIEGEFTFTGGTTTNSLPITQTDDDVYNTYALNGSTITKFEADYVDDEVDLILASDFLGSEVYAWWVYNLTTSQGIADFFGGITAVDTGNIRINNAIVNIFLDNDTTANRKQTDATRIFRADGAYPVKDPTTGGGGVQVNWLQPVYTISTGSAATVAIVQAGLTAQGLTTGRAETLDDIAPIKAKTDSLTFTVAGQVDANTKAMNDAAVLGNGTAANLWRGE